MRVHWLAALGLLAAGGIAGWTIARSQVQTEKPVVPVPVAAPEDPAGGDGPLATLDWLVGEWVDTSDDVTVEFSCNFTKNGSFLVRPFRIVRKTGETFSGMQVIGWDPARETVRSWTFDSAGGFGEETWSQSANRYSIRAKYTLPDGGTGAAIHVMTYVDDDTFTWKSVNREIDGQFQPDTGEIKLVRKQTSGDAKGGK